MSIERIRGSHGEKFIYHHGEFDPTDEEPGVNEKGEYDNFEQPFQLINSLYPWHSLHIETIHEDYRDYALKELLKVLMRKGVTPDELNNSKTDLEEKLQVKLEFGNPPLRNCLQEICIEIYDGSTTEYEYANLSGEYYHDSVRSDDLKLYKKIETPDWKVINCKVAIHFSDSTIIIHDENKQPIYVFNSEKAFIKTKPILNKYKRWYYKKI